MTEYIIEYLPDTTSIEREEIVRCRDCKWSYIFDGNRFPGKEYKGRMYCIVWGEMQADWTKPNGFCHKAKRKEVDE